MTPRIHKGPKPPSTTIVTKEQKELRKIAKKLREIQRLEALKGTRDFTEAEQSKLAGKAGLEKQTAELEATVAANGGGDDTNGGGGGGGGGNGSVEVEAKRMAAADRIGLAEEYIALNKQYPSATMSSQIFHVRRICKDLYVSVFRLSLLDRV